MPAQGVSLHVLPPADADAPVASISYLAGYLATRGLQPQVIYWSQKLAGLLADRFPGVLNPKFASLFYHSLFGYLYARRRRECGRRDAESLAEQGAAVLRTASVRSFVDIADEVETYVLAQLAALGFEENHVAGCSAGLNQAVAAVALLRYVKMLYPKVFTVLGGMVRGEAELFLRAFPCIDAAVFGEGEETLLELAGRTESVLQDGHLAGAAVRLGDRIVVNEPRLHLESIEGIYADYSGFRWRSDRNSIFVLDSRSCPWKRCRFCSRDRLFGPFRSRSVTSILSELRFQIERHPVLAQGNLYVSFIGVDAWGGSDARFLELLRGLREWRQGVSRARFFFWLSPSHLTQRIAEELDGLGADIQFGFEQWNEMVERMRKPHCVEDGIRALRLVERHSNIRIVGFNLLVGYPGETIRDVAETMATLHKLRFVLSSLMRRGQVPGGIQPIDVTVEKTSALGRRWDWGDPAVAASLCNSPYARTIAAMAEDEEAAAEIARYKGWIMGDATGTQRLGRSLCEDFLERLARSQFDIRGDAHGGWRILETDAEGRQTEMSVRAGPMLALLGETESARTFRELCSVVPDCSAAEVGGLLTELEERGWMYRNPRTGRYISTLPLPSSCSHSASLRKP